MSHHPPQPTPAEPVDVFLVEDNPGDVRLIEEALATIDRDVRLDVATHADDAVAALLDDGTDGAQPDVVLLDLNLPGRDGCAVLEEIRRDADFQALPVLVLSSSHDDDDVARCYDAAANAYLTKPRTLAELTDLMETLDEFWFERVRLPPLPE